MSGETMKVLTRESILRLRGVAHGDPKLVWESHLDDLIGNLDLETIDVEVLYERGHEFLIANVGERRFDRANAERIKEALPELTPSQATDERIWATLALGDYKEYVLKRWASAEGADYAVGSKIFVSNTRGLVRDHSIARLWWRNHFASLVARHQSPDPLDLFFAYEDLPGEISGRSILTDPKVLSAYVGHIDRGVKAITSTQTENGLSPKKYIQGIGKQLNFLSGRFHLGGVSDKRLGELLVIAERNVVTKYS